MQICISISEKTHPCLMNKISEIKGRKGNVSGEISHKLEKVLSNENQVSDNSIIALLTDIKGMIEDMKRQGFSPSEKIDESTNTMLEMMNFTYSQDD